MCIEIWVKSGMAKHISYNHNIQDDCTDYTLKREPIDENLEDLVASSESEGKRPATKKHLEAPSKS